jgi:hypothetical protein
MWWVMQNIFPRNAIDAWVLVLGAWFWIAAITLHPYAIRQIPGTIIWTDILNMVTVDLFNGLPIWWWAHGWTITLLPWFGWFWVTWVIWIVCLIFFGPSLFAIGLNIH